MTLERLTSRARAVGLRARRRPAGAAESAAPGPVGGAVDHEARLATYYTDFATSGLRARDFVRRNPRATAATVVSTLRLDVLQATLSDSEEGRQIRDTLRRRTYLGLTVGQMGASVLPVPATPADYSLGAARQTLRRKVRKARKQGVVWREVDDRAEREHLGRLVEHAVRDNPDAPYSHEFEADEQFLRTRYWAVAYSAEGEPLLVAVLPVDGSWALLQCFVTLGDGPAQSDARYLMTQAIVESLGARGVRHIVDTAALADLTPGLRHFQRMLGFRTVRVRVVPAAARHDGTDGPGAGPTSAATTAGAQQPAEAMASSTR